MTQVLFADPVLLHSDRHPEVRLGGEFQDPPISEDPLFRLHARSRMNIYLDTDADASILVDATVVHQAGEPLPRCFWPKPGRKPTPIGLEISYDGKVLQSTEIDFDTADNEISFSLDGFEAQFDAYQLTVTATLGKKTVFTDTAELLYLPYPEDYGSVSRLDDLYGGLYVQRGGKDEPWEVIFPYTFYSKPLLRELRGSTTTFVEIMSLLTSNSSMDPLLECG
jgi:hypothetical protein